VPGIDRARRALQAVERGETAEELFADVGDDWDADERAMESPLLARTAAPRLRGYDRYSCTAGHSQRP
jgi:hypothetical protein